VSASSSRPLLGLWPATTLVVGHTIAVGIFLTPAELIGAIASPALTLGLWIVCGALVFAGALTFGELAARYPLAGGPYIYLRQGWGERVAFLYGWQSLLILDPGVTAALAVGLAGYIVVLWPAAAGFERWLAVAAIWTLALVSVSGLTLSARVLASMTALKLAAFAAVVAVALGAGAGSWSHFQPFLDRSAAAMPIGEALALGLIGVFFSFGGFWEASRIASEVRNPTRTMPAALAIGVASVTAVYVATTIAFIYLVPVQDVTTPTEFARRAGEAMLGEAGPRILAAIVVVSVATSALALLIMAPRLYVAMSHDGLFPPSLASVNDVTGAPAGATLLLAVLATVFVLAGTFQQIVAFFLCTALVFIALAAAALVVVRRDQSMPAFTSPGYPFTVALFVLLVVSVVVLVAINRHVQALAGFAIVLAGWPVYELFARSRARLQVPE
jgi:basic amino acid/polyamine antiporter, APA family